MKNLLKALATFVFAMSSLIIAAPSGAEIKSLAATQCDNWPGTCNVTFNSGIPGSNAASILQTSSVGPVNLTPFNNPSPMFTYPGYTFLGWIALSTSVLFSDRAPYSFVTNIVLTAQWVLTPTTTIGLSGGNGTSQVFYMTGPQGSSITLPSGSGLSNPGYTFTGWNTAVNTASGQLLAGSSYLLSNSTSLYAQWFINSMILINFYGPGTGVISNTSSTGGLPTSPTTETPLLSNQFALVLNPNGGSGSIPRVVGIIGNAIAVPASVGMSKSGYVFVSWNTAVDGSGVKFIPTESVIASAVIVLYAQWSALLTSSSSTLLGTISSFAVNSSTLTPQLKTQIHNLAVLLSINKLKNVTIYGYTTYSTATASNLAISQARANTVAQYLRTQLTAMSVFGVLITAKGEGSVRGQVTGTYRRVEIFV